MTNYAVLISGWSGPGIEWRFSPIRHRLRSKGYQTHHFGRVGLGWNDIWHISADLCEFIYSLDPDYDDSVFLVGHSMGGLVARAANRVLDVPVDGIVTLGTPHYGCEGAERALFSASATQMACESEFLADLNENETQRNIMSVAGVSDKLVSPERAVWKGSNRVLKASCGHLSMLYNAEVARRIVHYFDSIRSGAVVGLDYEI